MVIFMLAECSLCGTLYAVAPDVSAPARWLVFERKPMLNQPSHICIGGLMSVNGHALRDVWHQHGMRAAQDMSAF